MTRKVIDLDEIAGELEDHEIKVAGKVFHAPADLSVPQLLAVERLMGQKIDLEKNAEGSMELITAFFTAVFGEEEARELVAVCGIKRMAALITALTQIYELDAGGKVPASSRASRRAGARSKPTSNGSTRSISAKPASAAKRSGARASHG